MNSNYAKTKKEGLAMNSYTKIEVNDLLGENFRYGMNMSGKLWPNEADQILIEINSNYMDMIYADKEGDFLGIEKQRILLDWKSKIYGNTRVQFICPVCKKPVSVLNNRCFIFMCRKCSNSAYKIDNETDSLHLLRLRQKLEKEDIAFHIWK